MVHGSGGAACVSCECVFEGVITAFGLLKDVTEHRLLESQGLFTDLAETVLLLEVRLS
jgi:hypothetical protein